MIILFINKYTILYNENKEKVEKITKTLLIVETKGFSQKQYCKYGRKKTMKSNKSKSKEQIVTFNSRFLLLVYRHMCLMEHCTTYNYQCNDHPTTLENNLHIDTLHVYGSSSAATPMVAPTWQWVVDKKFQDDYPY